MAHGSVVSSDGCSGLTGPLIFGTGPACLSPEKLCSKRDVSEPELPGRHSKEPGTLLMSLGPSLHLFPLAWAIGPLSPTSASGPKPTFQVAISNHKAKAVPACNSHPDPRTSHTLDLILVFYAGIFGESKKDFKRRKHLA